MTTAQKKSGEDFRQSLKLKHLAVKQNFKESFPQATKYLQKKGLDISKLRKHSAKLLGAGALTGTLVLSPPSATSLPAPHELLAPLTDDNNDTHDFVAVPQKVMLDSLKNILPKLVRPLTRQEEKHLERVFETVTGIPARATLEGEHLNTTYGYIGAEQHLKRYPGDTLNNHGEGKVLSEGIAPGLGAWGYFSNNRQSMTPDLEETEKWYAVVQTLYLKDWNTRSRYLRDWYKYRKVLIVNTDNGRAVVASIADSGPAAWTGKSFGGSPEVMDYLGGPRYKKGPVVVFFVDDPENKIPLGPVEYNNDNLVELSLNI